MEQSTHFKEWKYLMNFKNLRICFIAGTLGVGGAERQLYHILSVLKQSGANVHLISIHSGEFWEDKIKGLGIGYHTLAGKGNSLQRLLKIIGLLREIKPQLIQSQHFYTNLYTAIAGKILGIPAIGASRNELIGEIKANGLLGKYCFSLPKYFVANSQESVEQAMVLGRDKSTVFYLPNALDFSNFKSRENTDSQRFLLLTVGRAAPQKRFERFVQLIAGLKKEGFTNISGMHLGEGPLLPELKKMASDLGLDENDLVFLGKVPDPENYYIKADALVLTSDYEGTPNVVLEAMASKLPVIVPRVGNLPYFIEDGKNGLFFDKENAACLLKQSTSLVNDKGLSSAIAENAYRTVMDMFSLDSLPANLEKIYRELIERENIKL
jgi:glycosyltransferase involved in cell wall biosynthesis